MRIVDPQTQKIVPRGLAGEICARGYVVMKCYYNNPNATHSTIDSDGWNHTGDLGVMDEDGYVRIVGRLKDMVIRGGENIYPREIEEFLHNHPKIQDAYVIGVPDVEYGEELMAWIKPEDGCDISEQEIIDFCTGRIARYKIPRYIKFVTISGKIQKFKMREESIEELGLQDVSKIETA